MSKLRTRHIFTQEQIATKFKNDDIDYEIRSHRGNYTATRNTITHYRTTEAIRTHEGKLIANTQCFADGFAKCSFGSWSGDFSLPLTTLERITEIHSIEVLDRNREQGHIVFRAKNDYSEDNKKFRYFLFGFDEYRPFLTELPHEVSSVKEAIESLTPFGATGKNVKRQGDLLFVKSHFTDKEVTITDYEHYKRYCKLETNDEYFGEEFPEYYPIVEPKRRARYDATHYRTTVEKTTRLPKIDPRDWSEEYRYVLMYEGKTPLRSCVWNSCLRKHLGSHVVREHHKPQILETNHKVNKIGSVNGFYTLVKGKVTHDRRQHSRLDLSDAWYIVYKNLAKQSWQVEARGGGGGD